MAAQIDLDLLRRSLLLQALPLPELERLAAVLRPRRYRRDAPVFHQDDPGDELHLVVQGHLKVVMLSPGGDEAVLTVVGPGELFGEMSLLDGGPRSATVIALEPVETYALRRQDFLQLLHSSPATTEGLLAALAKTIRRLSDEVLDLMFLDLRGRLAKKLLELADVHGQETSAGIEIEIDFTQDELAAMIGATRPRVSTMLGLFEDQGAIARRTRRVLIRREDLLRRWAGD